MEEKNGLEREIDEYLERETPSSRNNPSVLLESAQMELQKQKSDLLALQRERQTWNMLHQSDQSQIRELEQTILGLKRDIERLKRLASSGNARSQTKAPSENRENVPPTQQPPTRLSPLKHTRSTIRKAPPVTDKPKESIVCLFVFSHSIPML